MGSSWLSSSYVDVREAGLSVAGTWRIDCVLEARSRDFILIWIFKVESCRAELRSSEG